MKSPQHDRKQMCVLGRSQKATYKEALSKTCPINHPESPVLFEKFRENVRVRDSPHRLRTGGKRLRQRGLGEISTKHPARFQVLKHTHTHISTITFHAGITV